MKQIWFIIVAVLCFAPALAHAAGTYYIDCSSGNDSHAGTSTSTAWLHHPYMHGWTGSYSHAAGDQFYFKGGVTCPNSYFPLTPTNGGTSTSPDYYGPDPAQAWFAGSSWTRPIWDMQSATVGAANVVVNLTSNGIAWVTFDNFEVINFFWNRASQVYGDDVIFSYYAQANQGISITHNYVHRWSHGSNGNNCTFGAGHECDNLMVVLGTGQGAGPYFSQCEYNCVMAYNVIACPVGDGSCDGVSGDAMNGSTGIMHDNVIHDTSNGVVGVNYQFYNNQLYNINSSYDGYSHCNAYEGWPALSDPTPQYVYNNVIHDIAYGCYGIGLFGNDQANSTSVYSYVFNNVLFNIHGANYPIESDAVGNTQNVYIYNNTLFGLTDSTHPSGQGCLNTSSNGGGTHFQTLNIRGNHCITDNSVPWCVSGSCIGATTLTTTPNSVMTLARANTSGYTTSEPYVGQSNSSNCNGVSSSDGCPIGAGVNLNSLATGSLAPLADDTSYGVTVNGSNQIVSPARIALSRGGGSCTPTPGTPGCWDAGAYQYQSSAAAAPTFSPPAGTYTGTQTVAITSSTSGAIICWNTSGSPATNGSGTGCTTGTSLSNGGTISVAANETVYAVAGTASLSDSSVASAVYAINNVLTYAFTGSAYGSWASTYGIACPPTCSGSITVSSLDTVEITETSNVLAPADTWGIYTGFGGACTGFVWCFVPMNAGPQTVTGGFISQPLLPQTWVNNQEWVGGYTETINFPSGWTCGATNYGPYTAASQTSLAQAVADAETCRKNTGFGTRINIPKALYSGSAGIVLPQTAGDTATTFIVLASSTLLPAGQTVLSHGIQDNIPESIQPGLRNPFGDGTRMSYQINYTANNLYTLTTTTSAITAGTGVYVGVVSTAGMSLTNGDPRLGVDWGLNHEAVTIIAIPSSATCTANSVTFPCVQATFAYNHASGTDITAPVGAFTFANGAVSNTANFNDEASMPDIEYTAGNQGISVGTGSDESPAHNFAVINLHVFPTPCAYTPSPTAPACTGGNITTLSEITTSNALTVSGTSSVNQLPNHIHFLGIYLSADFTDTTAAGYPVGRNSIVNGLDMPTCLYCSEMFSYHDRLLYPGAEGHQIQLGYSITIKLARNWLEGESSGRFCGGYGAALLLTTVSMCTDVEFRGNRSTYPLSWMQAYANGKHVNNGSASFVRKNASETKVADRFLDDGNILENIDESGAQAGQPWSAKVSANNAANGWMSTTNLTLTNNVMRNGCNGPDWGDSGSTVVGFGGGNSLGVSGVWVVNNLIYNMGDNSVGCAGTSTNKLFAYAPSINLFPTCAMTSGASTNPDGTTPVAGSCTAITNGLQLDLYNGWPIALNNCTDATFNSPLTAIGPLAYNTTPTSLTFSANIPGATLGATGVNCQFGQGTGSPFFVTVAHNTFIGAGSGSAIYLACLYTSYEPGTGTPKKIAYFARNSTIVNNLCAENSTKTSLGNQGFSGVNEGTSVENVISDANTMLFYKDAIAGRAAHGIVNCAVAGATNTCTVTSGDAPNIWSGAIVGKNTLINGVPYGPVESGPTSTTFRITTANGPGVVTGATWLFAQYTEYGGVNNAISPPRTITFPDGTSCISNDPTLTLYGDGVPSCIGIFGAMSITNYPLALTDFNLYRLCLATDAGCNNKASLYGAGQTYQATDGTDMGANIPTILNEQVVNIYTCSSPCGSGPYPDYAPSAVGSFTLGVKATPGVVLTQ